MNSCAGPPELAGGMRRRPDLTEACLIAQVTLKSIAAGDDWSGDSGWFTSAMFLAEAYGWSATRPWGPDAPAPLISRYGWRGDMFFPSDARALGAALRSACGAPAPRAALPGEAAGDETTPQSGTPLLTAFRTPEDMRALATLADFCGRGGFRVLWPPDPRR